MTGSYCLLVDWYLNHLKPVKIGAAGLDFSHSTRDQVTLEGYQTPTTTAIVSLVKRTSLHNNCVLLSRLVSYVNSSQIHSRR